MPKIYCKQGGLMEDPDFHWEYIGEAEGTTLKECCDNLAKNNVDFAESYKVPNEYRKDFSYCGWTLGLAEDVAQDVLGKALKKTRAGM